MPKLLIPISQGFEEIEAVSIIDICRRANIDVTVAAISDIDTTGANGITIKADILITQANANEYDMMVLPGGLPNAFNLAEDATVQSLLQQMQASKKYIGAICAAPYALHTAGVLNENFTCYPSFEQKIRLNGYSDQSPVVQDGQVITSRGPGTAMTFALELVKILCGKQTYHEVKSGLLAI